MEDCFRALRPIYYVDKTVVNRNKSTNQVWSRYGLKQHGQYIAGVEACIVNDELQLKSLAVAESVRGERLSLYLIEAVMSQLENNVITRLSLWCVEETGNVDLFERLGFKEDKREISQILRLKNGCFATEVNMVKVINHA